MCHYKTLEIDVWVVKNGTKITVSVFLILQICIDFNNILISFLENLLMYLKICSLFFSKTFYRVTLQTILCIVERLFLVPDIQVVSIASLLRNLKP